MTKKELRKAFSEKRERLAPTERLKLDDMVLIQFQRISFENVSTLLSFWPMEERGEMNTFLFARYVEYLVPGLRTCYPKVDLSISAMEAYEVDDDTDFVPNRYTIPEPADGKLTNAEEIDMVFVPLLAFDQIGYRVGYGKGFYDRYLARCRPDVVTVGFSYFEAVDIIEDTNQYDVPLNYCITPQNVYEF